MEFDAKKDSYGCIYLWLYCFHENKKRENVSN